MVPGIVKWFDGNKGFGLLESPVHEALFIHITSFIEPTKSIRQKEIIVFSTRFNRKKNREEATNCRLFDAPKDFHLIFQHLNTAGLMAFSYQEKDLAEGPVSNLIALVSEQFFSGKDENFIRDIFINYFMGELEEEQFLPFCYFLEYTAHRYVNTAPRSFLEDTFAFFGNNLTERILFLVWKCRQFRYIGYIEKDDYEIPQQVLQKSTEEIGPDELDRIINFSYGKSFYENFIKKALF